MNGPTPVALYMMPGCAVCLQVKQYLSRFAVPHELRWLSEPEHLRWVQEWVGRDTRRTTSAPFTVLGDEVLQGYDPAALGEALTRHGYTLHDPGDGASAGATGGRLPHDAWWVASFLGGSIGAVLPDGGHADGDFMLEAGSMPIALSHDPATNVVAVADFAGDRLLLFDNREGAPLRGELASSALPLPRQPSDIAHDDRRQRFYVVCAEGSAVVVIDSKSGSYAFGTLEASTIPTGAPTTGCLAIDPTLDRLFVRRHADILCIDLETLGVLGGSSDENGVATGLGRNIVVDPETHRLYVPSMQDGEQFLDYLDGKTGAYAFGDVSSSRVATPATPFGLAIDSITRRVFVSCLSEQLLCMYDADAARAAPASEPVPVGRAARTLSVDRAEHVLAVGCFDDSTLMFLSSETGGYAAGDQRTSTRPTGEGPRGITRVRSG